MPPFCETARWLKGVFRCQIVSVSPVIFTFSHYFVTDSTVQKWVAGGRAKYGEAIFGVGLILRYER